ncbi:response regulator [Psychrobium sp. 1_MG-2023]|uniref:response regulator n=1 Tax=Psychrobium sp. 1_MG-2023 TaxID=3062624 RepID=UPI000C321CC7|nr:response regulator [Psychrobium sp. 1_MG-2023]MDP2561052.1 response regulator [Psychrobium sp. 1_MG-2023]PKF58343.1 DNA-binding response regulator [Alteromonadales bacterium alter-6D02]
MKHILLVEDDARLSALIKQFLVKNSFKVTTLDRGDHAVDFIRKNNPDLCILDITLPYLDGFSILKAIKPAYQNPVLFLTAKDSDFDHVRGLEIGADDYIIKPVEPHVLLARINSVLRRAVQLKQAHIKQLTFGQLSIDHDTRTTELNGKAVDLTSHEFELLWLLASSAGEVQSRDYIHQQMIGREYDGFDRSVDVRVSRLRKKLQDDTKNPYRIITVWGKGYVLSTTAWD